LRRSLKNSSFFGAVFSISLSGADYHGKKMKNHYWFFRSIYIILGLESNGTANRLTPPRVMDAYKYGKLTDICYN